MKPYRRSALSKLIEEVTVYTNDIERITLLRDKNFKMWTLEANREQVDHYKAEWERYNKVIEVMQYCLLEIHKQVVKEKGK